MLLAAISDIHGSIKMIKKLSQQLRDINPDLVIIAGDISHFGNAKDAVEILSEIPFKKAAVPGNCDFPEIIDVFEETDTVDIHGKKTVINGLKISGLGASNPLPFPTLFTYNEENIYLILDSISKNTDILVTHTPPYGILDRTVFGHRGGSESIRKIIEKYPPKLSIFGHIHESPGIERRNKTLFINPGPLKDGNYSIIEINDEIKASRYHL